MLTVIRQAMATMKLALSETSFWIDSLQSHMRLRSLDQGDHDRAGSIPRGIGHNQECSWVEMKLRCASTAILCSTRAPDCACKRPNCCYFSPCCCLHICHRLVPTGQFVWELDVKSTRPLYRSFSLLLWLRQRSMNAFITLKHFMASRSPRKSAWKMNGSHIYSSIALFSFAVWNVVPPWSTSTCMPKKCRGVAQFSDGKEDRFPRSNYFSDEIWFMMPLRKNK